MKEREREKLTAAIWMSATDRRTSPIGIYLGGKERRSRRGLVWSGLVWYGLGKAWRGVACLKRRNHGDRPIMITITILNSNVRKTNMNMHMNAPRARVRGKRGCCMGRTIQFTSHQNVKGSRRQKWYFQSRKKKKQSDGCMDAPPSNIKSRTWQAPYHKRIR